MPIKAAPGQQPSKLRHNPIFPADLQRISRRAADGIDLTQALWPWYLVPWQMPDVSPETRAFVEGSYTPEDEEEKSLLLTELTEMGTVRGIGANPIVQQPGGIASERGYQRRKGMQIISRVIGEPNDPNQPLEIRGPSLEDDPEYGSIGLKTVVAELERRQPWALAQLDARILAAEDMAKTGDSTQRTYHRVRASALKRIKRRWEVGIPTVAELQRWFLQFERMRIQSRRSAQYLAEQARERQIASLDNEIDALGGLIERDWGEPVPA